MKKLSIVCGAVLLLMMASLSALAGDTAEYKGHGEMGPMGAPEQMKEVDFLIGKWDVTSSWRMSDTTEWMDSKAVASYSKVLDGCALHMFYESEFMGTPFNGSMIQTYNRSTGKWQSAWVDNMSAQMSYYEGTREGDRMVMDGIDHLMGMEFHSRITISNTTDTSFDWTMEHSMDGGENWWVAGKATYTKQK